MGCCSSQPTDDRPGVPTREVTPPEQASPLTTQSVGTTRPAPQETRSGSETPQPGRMSPHERPARDNKRERVQSAPKRVQTKMDDENVPPLPSQRSRTKSYAPSSSKGSSLSVSAEHSRASPRRPTMSYPARRPLASTVRQMLPESTKFRILVIGKTGSGKSSLIKSVFKVDVSAAPERAPGKADISVEFRPENNRYLIVHECSGLEDSQGLQTVRNFISHGTDPNRSASERLHVVWICVPASDAIAGSIGEGVEEILGMRTVPVVLVLTKFDLAVSQVLVDMAGGDSQNYDRARGRAQVLFEDACRRILHKHPRDVPAEVVSEKPRFVDLIDNLIVATDRIITGSGVSMQRVGPVPLAWAAALRVNHDIIIQASIEVGRNRYWCNLWSSLDFAEQTLKNCVNIIHTDIIEIWNLDDKRRYLSSDRFKAKMSHLIKDLAGSANAPSGADPTRVGIDYADWVHDVYRGSQENVRCVMGYIVDLTVILDGIFRIAAGNMSPKDADQVFERHVKSGRREAIHRDIRSFVTEALAIRFSVPQKDLVLERIIDLIKQFCVPSSLSGGRG